MRDQLITSFSSHVRGIVNLNVNVSARCAGAVVALMRRTLNFNLQAREEEKKKKIVGIDVACSAGENLCGSRQQKRCRCKLRLFGECQKAKCALNFMFSNRY